MDVSFVYGLVRVTCFDARPRNPVAVALVFMEPMTEPEIGIEPFSDVRIKVSCPKEPPSRGFQPYPPSIPRLKARLLLSKRYSHVLDMEGLKRKPRFA